jgi:hypothetical protein
LPWLIVTLTVCAIISCWTYTPVCIDFIATYSFVLTLMCITWCICQNSISIIMESTKKNISIWSLSYGSWIYNYLCNHRLPPLMLWVRTSTRAGYTALCDKVCQWLATGRWFSPGPQVSSTNKTDRQDITEIVLKVALSTIKQTSNNIHHHPSRQYLDTDVVFQI